MAKCAIINRVVFCLVILLITASTNAEDLESEKNLQVLSLSDQKVNETINFIDNEINDEDVNEINDGDYDEKSESAINTSVFSLSPIMRNKIDDETEATTTEVLEIQVQPKVIKRVIEITIDSEEYTNVRSENFPDPYPQEAARYEWEIGFGGGFGVEMIIKSVDFAQDDYLLIRPGGIASTERQIMFAWHLKTERKFKLLHLDEMYIAFVVKAKGSNSKKGFDIDFKRLGVIVTTTTPEPTEEPPVTVAPLKEAVLYLGGKTPAEFLNVSETFKMELATVAEKYCALNNITTDDVSFFDNVNYHVITRCNYDWPDSIRCVEIRYSIAVYFDNLTGNYEMTAPHLDDMWKEYGNTMNLTGMGLQIYVPPDDGGVFVLWLAISGGILLTFLVILYFIWRCRFFYEYIHPLTPRESVASQKKSDMSLFPIPFQTVPPLYALDSSAPEDDRFWAGDEEDLPPKYSHDKAQHYRGGQQNYGYVRDVDFDLYSDEIIMSLPDSTARKSKDNIQGDESNL